MVIETRKHKNRDYSEKALFIFLFRLDRWLAPKYSAAWEICSLIPSRVFSLFDLRFGVDHPGSISPEEMYQHVLGEIEDPLGHYSWVYRDVEG